jgi:hypothetical protein
MTTIIGTSMAEGVGSVAIPVPAGAKAGDLLYLVVAAPDSPGFDAVPYLPEGFENQYDGWRNLNPAASNSAWQVPQTGYLGLGSDWDGIAGQAIILTRLHDGRGSYAFAHANYHDPIGVLGGIVAVRGPSDIWTSAGSPNTRFLFYQNGGVSPGTRVFDGWLNPNTYTPGGQDQNYWYRAGYHPGWEGGGP